MRFFLSAARPTPSSSFDVDLALKQNDENPVFYVQYAHARICSVLEHTRAQGGDLPATRWPTPTWRCLVAPSEAALMRQLADYPRCSPRGRGDLAPHDVAFYLRDLAAAFHSYYDAERFLVDDAALTRARLALLVGDARRCCAMRSPCSASARPNA